MHSIYTILANAICSNLGFTLNINLHSDGKPLFISIISNNIIMDEESYVLHR